tara:strand:- start:185 stop:523 length:339 start_codon:yes stop_codon:yes gene_type:complete
MAKYKYICNPKNLIEGGKGFKFEVFLSGQKYSAFVIKYKGKFFSYINSCAHLHHELDLIDGFFFDSTGDYLICSSHGALYEISSGVCVAGPCVGRKLVSLNILVKNVGIYWF